MRILLCHKFFNIIGGDAVYFHETGRILREHGHEVAYFAVNNTRIAYDTRYPYPTKNVFFGKDVDYSEGSLTKRILNFPKLIYSKENKEALAKVIEEFKPDIVNFFAVYVTLTPSVLEASAEAGIPTVLTTQDYKLICPNYKLFHHGHLCEDCKGGKFYSAVLNNCCHESRVFSLASAIEAYAHEQKNIYRKNIDRLIFSSGFMANKTQEFWGEKMIDYSILRNPFNPLKYSVSNEQDDYIIYYGRLVDEKGVQILLQAMKNVPGVKLLIVGEGPYRSTLEKQAADLQLQNAKFLGAKWGEDLFKLVRRARFVVVPSIWHENFPFVICEAFSNGKAVLGSDRGGIPELLNNGEYGFVYPGLNYNELAEKIRYMYYHKDKTNEMGLKARKYAEETMGDELFYKNLMLIYKSVIEKKKKA
jgi:glycosyltransferase involved in cell wall biosynthesis